MVNYTETDYKRAITHTEYRHGDKKVKKGGLSRILPKKITHNKRVFDSFQVNPKDGYKFANDVFLPGPLSQFVLPVWGGGFFLIGFIGMTLILFMPSDEKINIFLIFLNLFF